jgi:hypothetical protein
MGKKKVILAVFDFLQLAHEEYSDLSDKQCSNDYKELNTQFDAKWREIVDESCPEAVTVTNGNIRTDDYSLCDSSYFDQLLGACTALGGKLDYISYHYLFTICTDLNCCVGNPSLFTLSYDNMKATYNQDSMISQSIAPSK